MGSYGRWLGSTLGVALLAVAVLGSCALSRSGTVDASCTTTEQCEDDNPCTDDSCSPDGFCEPQPEDGSAKIIQLPYDCKAVVCDRGRQVEVPDDADLPTNPCVDASCVAGALQAMNEPDGTPCQLGQGTGSCQGGECAIICDPNNPVECNDDNECTIDSCDAITALCLREEIDQQPATGNLSGDCLLQLCVQGQVQDLVDDNDIGDDNNDCTADGCNDGVPAHPPVQAGTECGTGKPPPVCDAMGQCVGCNTPVDCGGIDTACQTITCDNQVCGVLYQPDGTVVSSMGPCQNQVCDGMGGTRTDVLMDDDPCDDGAFCNGTDQCLNGACNKHVGDPCPGADGDGDCAESCDEMADDCMADDPLGSACDYMSMMLPGECDGNGACTTCGVDTVPSGSSCHNSCDACSTDMVFGRTCHIDCTGNQTCKQGNVNCPNNYACDVSCGGTQGCQDADINCPNGDFHCGVSCITGTQPCQDARVHCKSNGSCDMLCGTGDRCQNATLNCADDACGAICAGDPVNVVCGNACGCLSC